MKKKIVIFSAFYPEITGGAEYQARIIADELRADYDVIYISVGHDKDEKTEIDGILVYKIGNPKFIEKLSLYFLTRRKIFEILLNEKPDVIYQRVLNSFSWHLSDFCRKNEIPFFLHVADNYCLDFPQSLSGFVRKIFFIGLRKNSIRARTNFIVQTIEQNDKLHDLNVIPCAQIYNFHPHFPKSKRLSSANIGKKIFWIGNARKVKRLDLYLSVAERMKDLDVEFCIVGRILYDSSSIEIEKKIAELSNVKYYGELKNSEVNQLLANAFLLINTSDSEGFSNTFIQSWMQGVPVISLNSNPDGLLDSGILGKFCAGDIDLLISHIKKYVDGSLLIDPFLIQDIARQKFGLENGMRDIKELLGAD